MRRILYSIWIVALLTVTTSALPPLQTAPSEAADGLDGPSSMYIGAYSLQHDADPVSMIDLGDWGTVTNGLAPGTGDKITLRNNTRDAIGFNGDPMRWEWTGDHPQSEPQVTPPALETPVPEPATVLIVALGLFVVGVAGKLRSS